MMNDASHPWGIVDAERLALLQDVEFFGDYTRLVNINVDLREAATDFNIVKMNKAVVECVYLATKLNNKLHKLNSKLLEEVCDGRGRDTIPVA